MNQLQREYAVYLTRLVQNNMKSDRKQTFSKFRQKSTKKQLAQTEKEMVKLRMETVKTNSG